MTRVLQHEAVQELPVRSRDRKRVEYLDGPGMAVEQPLDAVLNPRFGTGNHVPGLEEPWRSVG